jgi:hypothetical protein
MFETKLKQYENLIHGAAWRYAIPGILDQDDLYQEGCMILLKMLTHSSLNKDSVDFSKMFYTELAHGMGMLQRKQLTYKRGWNVVNRSLNFVEWLDVCENANQNTFLEKDPHILLAQERQQQLNHFFDQLLLILDDRAKVVLFELANPRAWEDIPEADRLTLTGKKYTRLPESVPFHITAKLLGWSLVTYSRTVQRVKHTIVMLSGELGNEYSLEVLCGSAKCHAYL